MGWLAQGLDGRFGSGLFAAVCGVVLIGAGARAGSPTFTELYDAQVRDGAELFGERRGAIDRAIDLAEVGAERRVVTMQTPHNPDDKYARIYLRDRALLDDGSLRIRNYELNEGESGVVLVGEWITDEAELFVALPELVRLHALYGADADREGGTIRSVHFTHGVFAEGIDWFAFNEAHEAWFDATRAGDPDADRLAPEPQSPRIMLMESYIFQFDWIVSRRKDTAAHEAARDARNLSITLFDEPSDPRQLDADFGATQLVTGDWLTTTMQRLA